MTPETRAACVLVTRLLDESQELHQIAKWLLELEKQDGGVRDDEKPTDMVRRQV